jgi:MFS family permease
MTVLAQEVKIKSNKKVALTGWIIVGLGALFYCYEYLLRIAPGAMVPQLMQDFGISAQGLGFMVGLYYVAYTPMQALVGILHDIYGPRRILTFAVALCVAGSLMFTMSHSVGVASIGRFLVGLGSAFAFVGVLKLAAVWLPLNRFAMVAGLVTALGMLAGMFGTVGLTHLVQTVGWKTTLLGSSLAGIVLLPAMWFLVRDSAPDDGSGVSRITRLSYKDTFLNLVKIIKNPQMWIVGFIGCVLYLSLSVFAELWGDEYITAVYGYQQSQASLLNSMVFFGWLVGSPLMGWMSDRLCRRRPLLTIGCFAAAAVFLVFLFAPTLSWQILSILFFLFGFMCSAENICFAVGRENAHPALAGSAVSYINMLVMLGGMVFQPTVGKFLDMSWAGVTKNGVPVYSAHDYKFALFFIPVALVIGGILTFLLKETYAKSVHD